MAYKDHPRTRGEKVLIGNSERLKVGSPPHTRGKALYKRFDSVQARITPAHAGKSLFHCITSLYLQDHPRTRGEK